MESRCETRDVIQWGGENMIVKIVRCVCLIQREFALRRRTSIQQSTQTLMQSFKSREYVRETFASMHYYCVHFILFLIVLIPMILLFVVLISLSFTIQKNSMECHMGLFTEPKVSCILFRYAVLIYLFEDILQVFFLLIINTLLIFS